MTVYLDMIFLENLILDSILLYSTGLILKTKVKIKNILLASIVGSIYSVIYYYLNLNVLIDLIFKFFISTIMIYIAFRFRRIKELLRNIICFYITSFIFGGGVFVFIQFLNSKKLIMINGVLKGKNTIITIFFGTLITFIFIVLLLKLLKSKLTKKDLIYTIKITINKKEITTKAILDTGNFLKDPITGVPVVIVEQDILKGIIDEQILQNIEKIIGGDMNNISENIKDEYISKLRIIPFSSLGKQNGVLLGIKAEQILIEKDEIINIDKVILGLYSKKLSKNNEFNALLGSGML